MPRSKKWSDRVRGELSEDLQERSHHIWNELGPFRYCRLHLYDDQIQMERQEGARVPLLQKRRYSDK